MKCLDLVDEHEGIKREIGLIQELDVHGKRLRSEAQGKKIWSGRWCHRRKQAAVRSRYAVRQFSKEAMYEAFAGTPGMEAVGIVLAVAMRFCL